MSGTAPTTARVAPTTQTITFEPEVVVGRVPVRQPQRPGNQAVAAEMFDDPLAGEDYLTPGELGLVATAGTTYTQSLQVPWQAWLAACSIGLLACALLMVNNIRDIPTDAVTGKHTQAVRLGDTKARLTYDAMLLLPFVFALAYLPALGWPLLVCLFPAAWLTERNIERMHGLGKQQRAHGLALIPVLRDTGFIELAYALGLFTAFAIS